MFPTTHLIIDTVKPSIEFLDTTKEYKAMFGDQTLDIAYRFKIIEKNLTKGIKPHVFCQLLKFFLSAISSADPTRFHFDIVRKSLEKMDKNELMNTQSVDLLAREFLKACNRINKKLNLPNGLKDCMASCEGQMMEDIAYCIDFIECPEATEEFEKQFFDLNSLSIWDNIYLKTLKSIGVIGEKYSKFFEEEFKKKQGGWDQLFWFQNSDIATKGYFFESPAFVILASVLWEDDVKKRVNFSKNNVAALTTNNHIPITKILSPKNEVIKKENQLQLFHNEFLIGSFQIPTISQRLFPAVFNGVKKINTVTGHRFIRHLIIRAFEQVINGHSDYRILKYNRGAKEIVECLGLSGQKSITNIKEIVHAMAYVEFHDSQIAGNLIQLSKYKSPITGRENEGYLITIGTPLLPYQSFDAIRKGECGLLIPVIKDPPLVGANRSFAGQYLLQMKLMAEFSKQSIDLFNYGAIEITEMQWEKFAQLCCLTSDVLLKIKERWTRDGDDGAKFLECVDDNFYTLGIEYQNELEFLKRQGELRIAQSKRGSISAIKQKKAKQEKKFLKI